MGKIVMNLQVPLQSSQVTSIYVRHSQVKRAEDVARLRAFDMKVVQVWASSAQDAEVKSLDELDRKTTRMYSFHFLKLCK
jgi:hypothetical protein